jgi:hypothetical protein
MDPYDSVETMKVPFDGEFWFASDPLPVQVKEQFTSDIEPRYVWLKLNEPIRQLGHDFSFFVVPVILSRDLGLRQAGRGVLCQSEAEAKESFEILSQIAKKPVVMLQSAGFATVGRITGFRPFVRECSVRTLLEPTGERKWLALDREINKATGEVVVIHRHLTDSELEAKKFAEAWVGEYNAEKKKHLEGQSKNPIPAPPPRCDPLTNIDLQHDLPKAKWTALKRQWPNICTLFEQRKANPLAAISDQQCQDAYLLDLVERGYNPQGEVIRADLSLINALNSASMRFSRRKKQRITDLAIYLIAFNWELGWCYLSDLEIAKRLTESLKTTFRPGQIKQYRARTLGLVAKHWSGPPPKLALIV